MRKHQSLLDWQLRSDLLWLIAFTILSKLQSCASPRVSATKYPATAKDQLKRGHKTGLNEAPFPRMVDMWFLALCLGVKEGNRKNLSGVKMHKFMDGTVLISDSWRIDALMLLAISLKDTTIVAEPTKIINLANEYAAGGLPDVINMLKNGDADAIYNLSDNLEAVIKKTKK